MFHMFQDVPDSGAAAGAAIGGIIMGIVYLAIAIVMVVSWWKIFTKAGEPGWAILVPILNLITICKVAGKPAWWFLLFCIPFVNFIIAILVNIEIAKRFGKGAGFGIGMTFLGIIFIPMLGMGSAQYNRMATA